MQGDSNYTVGIGVFYRILNMISAGDYITVDLLQSFESEEFAKGFTRTLDEIGLEYNASQRIELQQRVTEPMQPAAGRQRSSIRSLKTKKMAESSIKASILTQGIFLSNIELLLGLLSIIVFYQSGLTGVVLCLAAMAVTLYFGKKVIFNLEHNQKKYQYFKQNKIVWFTRISIRKDILMALGKLFLSIFTSSFFMFVNALYTAGMVAARATALYYSKREWEEKIKGYFYIGIGILLGGICYVVYSIRLFLNERTATYPMVVALVIAMYTFWELVVVIKDYIRARRKKDVLSEEIKLIGLASTLICVVLTQVAIMSFSYEGDASFYNGISGVVFGSLSALVGVYMMIRAALWKKKIV